MALPKRDALVESALALFDREGFHATGIDRILAEAGCAKQTLYHHFRSKDELILAALRLRDERFRNRFMRRVEELAETPTERLIAIFDALQEVVDDREGYGCTFINACAEYGDPASPIHALACEHKRLMRGFVSELARQAGAHDPELLASQLALLIDGAIVTAQVSGATEAPAHARAMAKILLRAQLEPETAEIELEP